MWKYWGLKFSTISNNQTPGSAIRTYVLFVGYGQNLTFLCQQRTRFLRSWLLSSLRAAVLFSAASDKAGGRANGVFSGKHPAWRTV